MRESFLTDRLNDRRSEGTLRSLTTRSQLIDFCSNDYLGIASNNLINSYLSAAEMIPAASGSTGSRLLTGNSSMVETLEAKIARFHQAEAGLIYTSGFEANTGLLSAVAGRGDTIIYDGLSHASMRDGIRLSGAESFSFRHNDPADLAKKLKHAQGTTFVAVESLYSMDGDFAPLTEIASICDQFDAYLIVDEAHATGVVGDSGQGLVQHLLLQEKCFARVHTFGKACGTMGAIVLGSYTLRDFLINFSRSFIYTTALPPAILQYISAAYEIFPQMMQERSHLNTLMASFDDCSFRYDKLASDSAIRAVIIPGNEEVKRVAASLQENDFDVRAILYPSVQKGAERLRIVLHAFNTLEQLDRLKNLLS